MADPYYSCPFIERGVVLSVDKLLLCCITHHGRGCPPVCDFQGGELPVDRLLARREEVRRANQEEDRHPLCRGCSFLEEKEWEPPSHPIAHLTIAHFTQCTLACSYCYVTRDGFDENPAPGYALAPILASLIRHEQLAPDAHVAWGGGEPTVYREFEECFRLLKAHGVHQAVATNGTVRSPVLLEGLRDGRASVVCSVDAGTAGTFRKIKKRDLFERVWYNLEEYVKTGGPVSIKYIFLDENCHEVDAFLERVQRVGARDVQYEVSFHVQEPSDAVVDAIAKFIYAASIERGLCCFEAQGGVASSGDALRERIEQRLDERVRWRSFLEKHQQGVSLRKQVERYQDSKSVRFAEELARYPRMMEAASRVYEHAARAYRFFTGKPRDP